MANKTTFWNFIKNNRIEIPIIQRDYAQGRKGKEYLRKSFLGDLKKALDCECTYVLVSSSAVYPEWEKQPFAEDASRDLNKFWKTYGTDKIAAEDMALSSFEDCYVIRPPYIYGEGNNLYREGFIFDCAEQDRKFYLPGDGDMRLQFFHVYDLCRFIAVLLEQKPEEKVYNVGNSESVTIKEWVKACYKVLGKEPSFVNVTSDIEQRLYFPFYNYEYILDVTRMKALLPDTISLEEVFQKKLKVIDTTATVICMENKMPLLIFKLNRPNGIYENATGNCTGTIVTV